MLNTFCRCFYFWSSAEDNQITTNQLSSIDQPDVCLDVSKAGWFLSVVVNLLFCCCCFNCLLLLLLLNWNATINCRQKLELKIRSRCCNS